MDLQSLEKERDRYVTSFFWLGLKIALIFGIPAFLGAFFGRRLDASTESGWTYTIIFLVIAFFVSWFIVIREYKKISKKLKVVEDQIREIKTKEK